MHAPVACDLGRVRAPWKVEPGHRNRELLAKGNTELRLTQIGDAASSKSANGPNTFTQRPPKEQSREGARANPAAMGAEAPRQAATLSSAHTIMQPGGRILSNPWPGKRCPTRSIGLSWWSTMLLRMP